MTAFIRPASRTRIALAIGVSAGALLLGGGTAFAQTAATSTPDATAQDTADAPATGDIVVTGFRAALGKATAKKKNAETVIESVSAEDIGKLPDNGIGESIARLPGISSQRNAGRANIISIRGFGPDFSTTTLNGRQQTTTNDSRAVEFDQYPSEILSGVDVYKTAEADHTAGGLVGSIDLRTVRPLEVSHRVLAIGARGTYVDQKIDPNSSDKGYRAYATFVDKFMDDRLGVAISAAYTDEPYQTRDFNAWGYGGYPGGGTGMNGIKTWSETDKLKRFGTNATVQAQMSDNFLVTIDGFYSHFVDRVDQRGFEMPFNCGGGCGHDAISNVKTNSNGLVTAATIAGTPLIENYANDRTADQYSIGWNMAWDNHDGWKATGDLSWSRTVRKDSSIQTTAGLGRALANPTAIVSYVVTPTGPQFTSNYNGASSALVLTDVEGWSGSPVQAGYSNLRNTKDDLVEAKLEVEREIGGFVKSIKVGADFTTRTKTLNANEGFLSPPNGATTAAIPSNLLLTPVSLDRGLGNIIAYDPRTLVANGVLVYIPNSYGTTKGYGIDEDVLTPYAMATLNGQLGGATLTGNIGVQGVHTSVLSSGQTYLPVKDDYWMVLPSMNLALRTNSDFVIRFAASKEYMRPRMDQLNNVVSFGVDTTRSPAIYSGGGGNPLLRPYQAWAFDLNFEKYFGSKGYLALQTFYKDITTYIDPSAFDLNFDYSGFPKPGGQVPSSPIGQFSGPVNTHGGHLYGAEIAGTLPFDVFSSALAGFGLTGGGGYTITKVYDFKGQVTTIPGYSKWVGSITAFYEGHGFSVRGSMRYRSSFLGDFALYSGGLDRQKVLAETIYDAQIGYDFPKTSALGGLSLYIQGQNLTNTRSATLGSTDPLSFLKYQSYGRRFVGGFTFKF
ncbi:MAG: TonB-dependent receptor [Sphingomonas sp.]|uniref:TonB-dependent receptor n=1 Tax=Sphingomonas sp. TaxID=28214 RepID=UPI001AD211B0|nr:TonB-dependent receptor [Sphingomonas sp.]MBN8807878.1 TonB-dependent receptor [Sphingomonas sp.]